MLAALWTGESGFSTRPQLFGYDAFVHRAIRALRFGSSTGCRAIGDDGKVCVLAAAEVENHVLFLERDGVERDRLVLRNGAGLPAEARQADRQQAMPARLGRVDDQPVAVEATDAV